MRLIEADAKRILAQRGLSVPTGAQLIRNVDEYENDGRAVAVKAQVLQGNRAGAGLIELVEADGVTDAIGRVGAAMERCGNEKLMLVEHQMPIAAEYYAAWRIDDSTGQPMLLFSCDGGTGIESRAHGVAQYVHPILDTLLPYKLTPFLLQQKMPREHISAVARYCVDLYDTFRAEEALLLEINPLVILKQNRAMALDAKMIVDDASNSRHLQRREYVSANLRSGANTPLEISACGAGFTFVELPGRVAVFSAGAGLGMCLTDMLADAGIPAANFSDATGGAAADKWAAMARIVFERASSPEIDAILVFFTLTATSVKSVISGLFLAMDAVPAPKPLVVGLMCAAAAEQEMTFEQAKEAVTARGYTCVADLEQAVDAVKKLVSGS